MKKISKPAVKYETSIVAGLAVVYGNGVPCAIDAITEPTEAQLARVMESFKLEGFDVKVSRFVVKDEEGEELYSAHVLPA